MASPIAEELAKHRAQPPDKRHGNYALWRRPDLRNLCDCFSSEVAGWPDEFRIGYGLIFAWGVLLLVVGWRGSRGRRDPLGAVLAIAVPAIGFIAAVNYAPELLQDFYVQALCTGIVTANVVRFAICVRGIGGNARKLVVNDINQGNGNGKPCRATRADVIDAEAGSG